MNTYFAISNSPKIANTTTAPVQIAIMVEIREDRFGLNLESSSCKTKKNQN